jgi:hypothetical protein
MKVISKVLRVVAVSWITLAVTASGISGMVLCFGADGHVAFEMAHEGRCQDAADAHGHGPQTIVQIAASASADCCGNCVDVSLSSDTMSQPMPEVRHSSSSKGELAGFFAATSCIAYATSLDAGLSTPRALPSASLRAAQSLLAQRTIILRV